MLHKRFMPILLIAVIALVLAGCTMHGGGGVTFDTVLTGLGIGVPTEATIAVTVNCNDNKNMWRTNINLVDHANNVHITAHTEWAPVSAFGATTCEAAAASLAAQGYHVSIGIIQAQGQPNGAVLVAVGAPGEQPALCGDLQPIAVQANEDTPDGLPGGRYIASGCLDHGRITFN